MSTDRNVVSVPSSSNAVPQTEKTNGTVSSSAESVNTVRIAGASEVAVAPNLKYIRLRVITTDNTNEVHFRIKEHTCMVRLKLSYIKRLGHHPHELRFMFDGHRIVDTDTPKSLGMIDDDIIEIYQEKIGGM